MVADGAPWLGSGLGSGLRLGLGLGLGCSTRSVRVEVGEGVHHVLAEGVLHPAQAQQLGTGVSYP